MNQFRRITLAAAVVCLAGHTDAIWAQQGDDVGAAVANNELLDLASIERRAQAAYERTGLAVVRITYGTGVKLQMGSGLIVSQDGHIVTGSGYVRSILDDELLTIHLADGRHVRGKALGWSSEWAIGLLQIAQKGPWACVDPGNGAAVTSGQLCLGLGYPDFAQTEFDSRPALQLGAVTSSAAPHWFTSSCKLKAGAYCVFDLDGRLAGVTSSVPNSGDPIHTTAEMIRTHWDALIAGKNLDRHLERVRRLTLEADLAKPPAVPNAETQGDEKDRMRAAIEKATSASVRIRELSISGTVVTADGYVIGCGHHKGTPGQKVTISFSDGRDAAGIVLGVNPVSDLSLMKITEEGAWPHVQMGDSTSMKTGAKCVVMGYPMARPGREPWVLATEVIKPTWTLPPRDEWSNRLWTAGFPPSISGASGGGVFDLQGNVVGILLGGSGDEMNHNRIELLRNEWEMLAESKPVESLDLEPLTEVAAAFRRVAGDLPPIAVEVLVDGKRRAFGTVVGSKGRILTKASEMAGALSCRLTDGRVLPAHLQKVAAEHDLAILKIDADLPEPRWSKDEKIVPGTLIAAIIPGQPPRAGIASTAARPSSRVAGGLGASLRNGDRGLEVADVLAGKFDVPLRKGDVMVQVNGNATPNLEAYHSLMERTQIFNSTAIGYAGDPVRAGVRRGSSTLELRFSLPPSDSLVQDHGGRNSSFRWWGFPSVFDTSISLTPQECGGPVIDKRGRVVGIVIASWRLPGTDLGQRHVIPAQVARGLSVD